MNDISFIIPAKNEERTICSVVEQITELYPDSEVIVVDDGSTDSTKNLIDQLGGNVRCLSHPVSRGNGSAIKTGARNATGDLLVFMDGDGQHNPAEAQMLLSLLEQGYDMVVGSRSRAGQASWFRHFANTAYNKLASWMSGVRIDDLTSGYRVVKADLFHKILHLLPNGFSYPTTSTMSLLRMGHHVGFCPINVAKRDGKSNISLIKDGIKFFLIIFKIGTLYSPMRLFFPVSLSFFGLGTIYYLYTYMTDGRFTNMGVLLFVTSLLVFLIGLVSEQVTTLIYK
ncbi:MAG: glycosyltransferase family 2 protein [bacterium]